MTRWKKDLSLKCGSCGRDLEVYIVKRIKDDKLIPSNGRVKQIGNKTRLSVRCGPCNVRTVFETELPINEKDGWKPIRTRPPLPYEAFMTPKPKKRESKRKPKQKFSKPKRGESLYLTCLYCGEDLGVYIIKNYGSSQLNRGVITRVDNESLRLSVKCHACSGKSRFERQGPYIGRYGWKRIDVNVEPVGLRPKLSEISETSAMLSRRRKT